MRAWLLICSLFAFAGCSDPSTTKAISSLSFLAASNPGLNIDITATISGQAIAAAVPYGTDVTKLVASFTTTGDRVTVGGDIQQSGVTPQDFTGSVTYTVIAADDSTQTYTVTVTVAISSAKEISDFAFLLADNPNLAVSETGTINGGAIAVTVPFGTDLTSLVATFTTTGAKVRVAGLAQVSGTTANDFTSPVTYVVSALDGSTRNYMVTVAVALDTAKDITAFQFLAANNLGLASDITATITGSAIHATVPFGTDVTALVATYATTGQSVKVAGATQTDSTTPNNFTSPVTYHVTAADGSTKDYVVTVTIAVNTAKELTSYQFLTVANPGLSANVTGMITGTAIAVTVPFGTDVTGLVATFATSGATVAVAATTQVSGVTPNNFSTAVTYTVTAADASTKTFMVTVTVAANPAKDITGFEFQTIHNGGLMADVVATIDGTNIAATVPFNTDVTALIATFATTGMTVSVGGVTQTSGMDAHSFTAPVIYRVTAADTTTQDYTVTITVASVTAKDLTAFSFASATNPGLTTNVIGTIAGTTIGLTVPFGTDLTALVATFSTTGTGVTIAATPQVSAMTANDFTAPVTYTVTAADASTQDYVVTVTVAPSCPVLVAPTGGAVVETNGGDFPSTATYTCNTGLLINGNATRTCASGTWTGADPTCDVAVMVVRVGDGTTALSSASAQVTIEERRVTDGGLGRTIALPVAASASEAAFALTGNSTSEGFLSLSSDGRYVTLAGYAAAPGVATIAATTSAVNNRVVARVDAAGTVDTSSLVTTLFSSSNVRSATSADGSAFWVSGTSSGTTGGVAYLPLGIAGGTQLYDGVDNLRVTEVIDGQLYVSTGAGATHGVFAVGAGLPTVTTTAANVIPTGTAAPYSFVAFDLNPVVAGIDTFYVAIDAGFSGGADRLNIQKWTFDGTVWTQDTAFAPAYTGFNTGARGLAGVADGTVVHLVATTAQSPANLVTLSDDGNTETPAVTVLATPGANYDYRGVAFSPNAL